MNTIISITDIVNANGLLIESRVPFKLHLSDACGSQSMWIEALESNRNKLSQEEINIIEVYFKSQNINLTFDGNTVYIN